jgi:hypothetical protein
VNHAHGSMVASIIVAGEVIVKPELDMIFGIESTSTWQAKPEIIIQIPEMNNAE